MPYKITIPFLVLEDTVLMGMGLWCLTPLSTILQLYRGGYCFNFLYSSLCKILDQHGLDLIDPGGSSFV